MQLKRKYLLAYMDMTCRFAETSEAVRLKVGASLVKKDSIIALGINGMPPKWPTEVCEDSEYFDPRTVVSISKTWLDTLYPNSDDTGSYRLITKPECRHAEVACLEKLYNSPETAEGSTMFISHSPCKFCAIKILTAKIKSVYYRYDYRDNSGVEYLRDNGVTVEKLEDYEISL
jgi:dCMP deaminase